MDLVIGQTVQAVYLVISADRRKTSSGTSKYLDAVLSDGETEIRIKQWNYPDAAELMPVGKCVEIIGTVGSFGGKKDITVAKWAARHDIDPSLFSKISMQERWQYLDYIKNEVKRVARTSLGNFTFHILSQYTEMLLTAAGAVYVHHNYPGGWVQHVAEVVKHTAHLVQQYPYKDQISEELAICGAALHDIGKMFTYKIVNGTSVEFSDMQRWHDHIIEGIIFITREADQWVADMEGWEDPLDTTMLTHIIASHHGELEYGSPVKPCIPEALIVHHADQLSSKLQMISEMLPEEGSDWTPKDRFLGTSIYKGPRY